MYRQAAENICEVLTDQLFKQSMKLCRKKKKEMTAYNKLVRGISIKYQKILKKAGYIMK